MNAYAVSALADGSDPRRFWLGHPSRVKGAEYFVKFDKIRLFFDFSGAAQRSVCLGKRSV